MSSRQRRRKFQRKRAGTRTLGVGVGTLALTLIPTGAAQAQTFPVTNLNDSGTGSLRVAIENAVTADATNPADPALITFSTSLSGTIKLESPLPAIDDAVDIEGPGARRVTLNANAVKGAPVIKDDSYSSSPYLGLTISGLSMNNAHEGFVFERYGTERLTLVDDTLGNDSTPDNGGGVSGGGLGGSLIVHGCTFSHDSATYGGAIDMNQYVGIDVSDSTIVNNRARNSGGALFLYWNDTTVTDSTISGNSASSSRGHGGAIDAFGGIGHYGTHWGDLIVQDTILGSNHATAGSDVSQHDLSELSFRFSLIQHTRGLHGLGSSDITGKAPDLGLLQNNGGPTNTELPKKNSPVINAGRAYGLKTDQRGDKRTVDYPGVRKRRGSDGTDIGAVERQTHK
jgi:hypothetical protein